MGTGARDVVDPDPGGRLVRVSGHVGQRAALDLAVPHRDVAELRYTIEAGDRIRVGLALAEREPDQELAARHDALGVDVADEPAAADRRLELERGLALR